MIVKMRVISGYWNIWAHVRWLLLDWVQVRFSRSVDIAYLEPRERAAFDDDSLLVLERKLIEVLVSIGSFRTDPFQKQKEQSRDGERLVETGDRLNVLVGAVPAQSEKVEKTVGYRQGDDPKNLSLFLRCCVVPYVPPREVEKTDASESQAWSGNVDHQLMKGDVAVSVEWVALEVQYGPSASDIVC
jgi:hypothetical protein